MTGFGWGSDMLVSSGPATFAYPYTGGRAYEQIGTFKKKWGSANQPVGRLKPLPGIFEGIQPFRSRLGVGDRQIRVEPAAVQVDARRQRCSRRCDPWVERRQAAGQILPSMECVMPLSKPPLRLERTPPDERLRVQILPGKITSDPN
jgi:hypothetical protein